MKSVGTSTRSATPIQKSEKRSAVMSERKRTPREKERKSAMGVKERMSWERRKVCGVLALREESYEIILMAQENRNFNWDWDWQRTNRSGCS